MSIKDFFLNQYKFMSNPSLSNYPNSTRNGIRAMTDSCRATVSSAIQDPRRRTDIETKGDPIIYKKKINRSRLFILS